MKTTSTKKIFSSILLLVGMFSSTLLNAQNCSGNKVWACRYDECHNQECKCVNANQLQNWLATVPQCNVNWNHIFDGFRLSQDEESAIGFNAYPNPVSPDYPGTTISFSLEQTQTVSLQVFDVSGRVVAVIANSEFSQGTYELKWNADVNSGIYFLQFHSAENQEMIKLIINR